ncbi:glycine receptor subunit alpha-4 isoform X2 [Chrysoperla carnea]|uniref:glycine receptor subunit alpha-4 isoform X2 n=1 Tax=Chrysoperla carnea TaxID=189513 RepID=UPI001D08AB6B|nr:glycine receptor subunit alpha-4 isoform X2 [Chrysoperla carnea]
MLTQYWIFQIILLFSFIVDNVTSDKNIKNVLPSNYVKEMRPSLNKSEPVMVDFSIYVVDINSINVEDMDFRIDMFVRQKWTEPRLRITDSIFEEGDDYVTLPPEFFDNLWQPDPYFFNSKVVQIAALTHKYSSVTLYRNKTVSYTARMHAIVACQMEFKNYPMDIQICPLYIESFSYNIKKVRFRWTQPGVTLNPELKLLQYHIGYPLQLDETNDYMQEKAENFSRLIVYFRFERHIGHHLIQTFAPSGLVVVLSWFSFYLGLDAIPGRVTLLVTCMLTLVTMFTGLKSDIPPVAYVKALDLWMAGCMVFVFAALAEFVIVKVLDVKYQSRKNMITDASRLIPMQMPPPNCSFIDKRANSVWDGSNIRFTQRHSATSVGSNPTSYFLDLSWIDHATGKKKILWEEIDRSSRLVFPALYVLFLVVYWPVLLFKNT